MESMDMDMDTAAPSPAQPSSSPPAPAPQPQIPAEAPAAPQPQQTPAPRPQQFQPLPQQQRPAAPRPRPPYSAFPPSSMAAVSHSPSPSPSAMATPTSAPMQRGGMALGVPAQPRAQQQGGPVSFSSFAPNPSFGQPFATMSPRMPEQSSAQVRTSVQGMQTIGMIGTLGASPPMRPSGLPAQHQPRPGQMQLRSPAPGSTQLAGPQKLLGQALTRASSMTTVGSQSTAHLQNSQSLQQSWASVQGKPLHGPSMPPPVYRSQVRPQQLQQRPSIPQQASHVHHQQLPPQQPQLQQKQQTQTVMKTPQTVPQQQSSTRVLGSANQKILFPSTAQQGAIQAGSVSLEDAAYSHDHILSKRSIHELVTQVDPSEKLDPEVEDILVEIADDFVESITTVACSLAKHRKSTILEAKDILLHLERNWNMSLPGFGGDEIKYYKKPLTNEIHKDRLAAIKKSMIGAPDPVHAKTSTPGQAATSVKSHQVKAPAVGSPK